jgi:toxin ParE1/3/4
MEIILRPELERFIKEKIANGQFLNKINQKFNTLTNFPNMGRRRDELLPLLRSFPVDDYLIFYRSIEEGIEILRVVSGYRDLEKLFDDDESI